MSAQLIGVVNSDAAHLRLLNEELTSRGYSTLLLTHGSEAYGAIKEAQPALVMLDSWLEHQDAGWELVKDLRLDIRTAHIPLLILSTEDPAEFDAKAPALAKHQRVEVLPAPFDAEELVAKVRRMLDGDGSV